MTRVIHEIEQELKAARHAEDCKRVRAALERHNGNRKRAAEDLGIAKRTLQRRLDGPLAELAKEFPSKSGRPPKSLDRAA